MWKETRLSKWSSGGWTRPGLARCLWPLYLLWGGHPTLGTGQSRRELALGLPWRGEVPLLCPFSSRSWNPERSSGRKEPALQLHPSPLPLPLLFPHPSSCSRAYQIMLLYLYTIQGEDPYYVENSGGQGYSSGPEASPEAQGKAVVNRGAQENGTGQATSRNGHSARQRVVADTEL